MRELGPELTELLPDAEIKPGSTHTLEPNYFSHTNADIGGLYRNSPAQRAKAELVVKPGAILDVVQPISYTSMVPPVVVVTASTLDLATLPDGVKVLVNYDDFRIAGMSHDGRNVDLVGSVKHLKRKPEQGEIETREIVRAMGGAQPQVFPLELRGLKERE